MDKLMIGICDDEEIVLNLLVKIIKTILVENKIQAKILTFFSGEELIKNISQFDVVFLDIEMKGKDGIEIGKLINKINSDCRIIMASSHIERFKEVFKIRAIRFVTKPFRQSEIEEAIEAFLMLDMGREKIDLFENRISIQVEQRQIQYMISYDSYTEFILNDRILRKNISLNELDGILDKKIFFRIHRKFIINMLFIQAYRSGVITINKKEFQVARRKKKEFEKKFIEFDLNYK